MRPRISIRGSVRPSVRNAFVSNTRKCVISASEVGGLQREVMGSDEGGRKRGDEGGATKDGASTDMPRDASDGRVSGLV